ncbi:Cof-type HAD-IIB family hydrolase [Alkalihalophilus pseudofirmus]|uniref:Cof-type HAD-IIB family hydrolase n=1 Tax=Alkalihalophilus pseudofirmus TaxID=79885 RepID=UPI00259BD672|nr:Cof-type HAD-IIB family hydrolase [Alkalihalophilus pseudofirmus]WEG18435.1 Cof-type HAD-IIB family hydrolase [Alkalihalophilus pseudofirmus]
MKMIAIDMDGTLLDDERKVTVENVKAIKEAQKRGIEVVIATGRDDKEARIPLDEAKLTCPVISVNGAEVQSADGKVLDVYSLDNETVKKASEILHRHEVYFELYTNKGAFTDDYEKGIETVIDVLLSSGSTDSLDHMREIAEERYETGAVSHIENYQALFDDPTISFYKLLAFTKDDQKRTKAKHELEEMDHLAISSSASDNLEITHCEAQKGRAVKRYAAGLDIPMEEVMVIGDNGNDLSMFKVAGHAVAMGNAIEEVKSLAQELTDTNDNSGVAKAIYNILS